MTEETKGASQDAETARAQPAQPVATTRHTGDESNARSGAADASAEGADLRPVSADMQQFIGRQLRAVFDDVAKQPIPDRFLELMKQLDDKTSHG